MGALGPIGTCPKNIFPLLSIPSFSKHVYDGCPQSVTELNAPAMVKSLLLALSKIQALKTGHGIYFLAARLLIKPIGIY